MTDKQIIIDASKCEWRTGVGHCGNYECMLNKCCDYNCDWYKRRKLEQQLKVKEQECERLKKQVEIFTRQLEKANKEVIAEREKNATQRQKNEKFEQTLTEIKEIVHKSVIGGARQQILQKISEVVDGNT